MIFNCPRCKQDKLTEADDHIWKFEKGNWVMYCSCEIGDLKSLIVEASKAMDRFKKELNQQRFNNEHNLSIDQKISDRLNLLDKQNQILKQALSFYSDIRLWERVNQTHFTALGRDKEQFGLMFFGGSKARETLIEIEKMEREK